MGEIIREYIKAQQRGSLPIQEITKTDEQPMFATPDILVATRKLKLHKAVPKGSATIPMMRIHEATLSEFQKQLRTEITKQQELPRQFTQHR